jgi:hypothetical protein
VAAGGDMDVQHGLALLAAKRRLARIVVVADVERFTAALADELVAGHAALLISELM